MNVRDISNDGLRQVIEGWLERGSERRAIVDRDPLLAANVAHLEEARDAFARLAPARPVPAAQEAKIEFAITQLTEQIEQTDAIFDQSARAGVALLDAAAVVAADDAVVLAQLTATRAALYPRGLSIVNLSPAEEAGVARSLAEALDDEHRALLGHLEFKVGSLRVTALSLVEQQVAAGKRLGKLVAKLDHVVALRNAASEPAESTHQSALARFGQARNLIVAAVSDFVRDVQRARTLSAADRAVLLATVSKLSPRPRARRGPGDGETPDGSGA